MEKKYSLLIKDIFIFALGSFGSKFILFFLVPLYTNYLSTKQYGTADLVFTISQVIIPIVSLVIFDSVIRFGLETREHPENILRIAYIIWLGGCLFLLLLMPFIGKYTPISEWKWYLYFYVILNILLSIQMNYLKVKNKNFQFSIISIIQTLSLAILNIILLSFINLGIRGYLLSNIVACLIACVIAFFSGNNYTDLKNSIFDIKELKKMITYSTPLVFNNLSWWIIQSSDKVMIQLIINESMLGLYTVATRIPSLISVIVSVFQQAWGISAIVEFNTKEQDDFYTNIFSIFTSSVFFVCIFLNSIIKYFMKIYVGNSFYSSWYFIPLLLCAATFSAIAAYFGAIYGALKKSVNNMISTITAGIINIIINLILIPTISVYGAVIGTLISYMYLSFIRFKDCSKFINLDVNIKRLLANSYIVIVHAVFVSLDCSVLISFLTIILFSIVNKDILLKLCKHYFRFK